MLHSIARIRPAERTLAVALFLLLLGGARFAQAQPSVTNIEATAVDEVVVTFDVDIDPASGSTLANYRISEKDRPTVLVPVSSITVDANTATLALGGFLRDITYRLLTGNIQPLGGGTPSPLVTTEFDGPQGDFAPPTVLGATSNDGVGVLVIFNEALDPTTAETPGNYEVFQTATPQNTVTVSSAALSTQNVTLTLASAVEANVQYTVRVSNVEDLAGNVIAGQNTATFTWQVNQITPIADIHENLSDYLGRTVTVRGQVYIPTEYRGSVLSGYIQDTSDRGINVFGFGPPANDPALQDRTAIVEVTGQIELFGDALVELVADALRTVSTGNPRLVPQALTTAVAANPRYEGTYIQVTGTINSQSVGGPGINYTVNDGSGPIVVRVVDALGAPTFETGQVITAAGAGGQFAGDFQILVGNADDIGLGAKFSFVLAYQSAPDEATLVFNARLDPSSVQDVGNYTVADQGGVRADLVSANLSPQGDTMILLKFASPFDTRDRWKVTVIGISDTEGGTIAAPGQSQVIAGGPVIEANLDGPARTFLPREQEEYPITLTVPQELTGGGGEIMLRIFDLTGRLQRTLYDSRFQSRVFDLNSQLTIEWDGLDDTSQRVPAGAYIAHLVVVDKESGDRQEVQMPVVVAARLGR